MARILVTGTTSGLGRYLLERLQGTPFRRGDDMPKELAHHKEITYDAIIHCATDARNEIEDKDLFNYYESHIGLTDKLTRIPHALFVLISSAAVYPDQFDLNKESDTIKLPYQPSIYGLYGLFKLLTEKVVQNNTKRNLILRTAAIVGPTSRRNNIMKVLLKSTEPISLGANSSYNLVSMDQILHIIKLALIQNISGIYNLGSMDNASLAQIAEKIGSTPNFGHHIHNVHRIDTRKIRSVTDVFDKTALQIAEEVAQTL